MVLPVGLIAAVGLLAVIVLLAFIVVSRYKVAGPNEAFIVTGRKGKAVKNPETGAISTDLSGQKVVMGGGVFVIPFIQRLHILDLSSRRIPVRITGAVSGQGVKLNLEGVAIVKVGGNEDSIRAAAQRFLTQQGEIATFTEETLAGSLRSIVGSLSVEQIIRDRAAFAQRVADESEASLTGQGLVLDTIQIQDITDDGTYLTDLGRPESAKVQQTAAIAEAESRRAAEQARIAAEQEIAISNRVLALKNAEIKAETDAASAKAAAAGPLAQADRDQEILTQQEKVAMRQAALKERELDTEVRKPADAHRYRVVQEAEGRREAEIAHAEAQKRAQIADAEADAERARLSGEAAKAHRTALAEAEAIEGAKRGEAERARRTALAEADAVEGAKRGEAEKARRVAIAQAHEIEGEKRGEAERARRTLEAEATRVEGMAKAEAIKAIGDAEAATVAARAKAFELYNEPAMLQLLMEVLPAMAREVSAPMGNIDKLTVVSTDGAAQLPKTVTENMVNIMEMLKNSTGIDVQGLIDRNVGSFAPAQDTQAVAVPDPGEQIDLTTT